MKVQAKVVASKTQTPLSSICCGFVVQQSTANRASGAWA